MRLRNRVYKKYHTRISSCVSEWKIQIAILFESRSNHDDSISLLEYSISMHLILLGLYLKSIVNSKLQCRADWTV